MSFQSVLCLFVTVTCIQFADTQPLGELPAMTQRKPTYWDIRWGIHEKLPQPVRAKFEHDFLVDFGTPAQDILFYFQYEKNGYPTRTTDQEAYFPNFEYANSCKTPFLLGTLKIRDYDYWFNVKNNAFLYRSKNRDGILNPSNEGPLKQFNLTQIRTCCETPDCKYQNLTINRKETEFIIYDRVGRRPFIKGKCWLCVLQDSIRECNNGEYATEYGAFDRVCSK